MDAIERLVAQIERLPTLPQVVTAALAELEREDCDFEEIASLVALDPVLAGRVLRLSNSVFFGAAKRADSVLTAISRLGIREVRHCLLTVAVMQAIPELPAPHSAKRFWTLSLASALVAQRLAQELGPRESPRASALAAEQAYTAALVHRVGEAVLAVQFTERYRRAIAVASADGIPLDAALSEEFGCDAADLGARVLREWRFAEPVIQAVQRQFAPAQAAEYALLASWILAADGLCREAGLGLPQLEEPPRLWLPKLAAGVADAVRERASAELPAYFDALAERVSECVDFALTVF